MAISSPKLLGLTDAAQPVELRRAALLVLREIADKDDAVAAAVLRSLDDVDVGVRVEAIRTAGKLRLDKALPELLARVQKGGEEAPPSAVAAANLGAKGSKALKELMHEVAPGLRRIIAGALAGADQAKADPDRLDVLLDTDAAVVNAAARSLAEKVPTLPTGQRRALADQVIDLLKPSKTALSAASVSALVRLLSALDDPRGEAQLWQRIGADQPLDVRAAALQALGKRPLTSTKDHLKKLLACALDRDFTVVAPTLLLLRSIPAAKKNLADWLPLAAPDVAVRHFVLEHLGSLDETPVIKGLLEQLEHPDGQLRQKALERLAASASGQKALAEALFAQETPDRAWMLARALTQHVASFSAAWRKDVFGRVVKFLEEGDHRADPYLFVLRHAQAKELRDRLEEKALALRKKKAYDKAITYLRVLGKDPACAFPTRLELAACGLKLSAHDLGPEAFSHDPALQQFESLYRHFGDELIGNLGGLKWLDEDDLYYLGFHMADRSGAERKLGEAVLQMVMARAGKGKIAQAARNKLRNAGLALKAK